MTYTLIGTGNMAHFLAQRFRDVGFRCTGVWGRDSDQAAYVASIAGADSYGVLHDTRPEGDCYFLTVSDAALKNVATPFLSDGIPLIHTTGSQPLLAARHSGVLWCMYSILREELPQHRNIPVVIDANTDKARTILQKAASAISDNVLEVAFSQRQVLHLAAVMGNNFINHLMAISEALLAEHSLSTSLLQPILQQTFERVQNSSPAALQTGPARRGDDITIARQLAQLSHHPDWQRVYSALSRSIENWYSSTTTSRE